MGYSVYLSRNMLGTAVYMAFSLSPPQSAFVLYINRFKGGFGHSFIYLFSRGDYTCSLYLTPHLIVQIEVVELSVGPEVLRVSVQGEVNVAAVAFDDHRVPVIVVQEAAGGHGGMAEDGAILVTTCNKHVIIKV